MTSHTVCLGNYISRCTNWPLSTQRSDDSTPSSLRMTKLITPSPRPSPATLRRKESHFCGLYSRSRSFGHYPELILTPGEDRPAKMESLALRLSSLLTTTDRYNAHITSPQSTLSVYRSICFMSYTLTWFLSKYSTITKNYDGISYSYCYHFVGIV